MAATSQARGPKVLIAGWSDHCAEPHNFIAVLGDQREAGCIAGRQQLGPALSSHRHRQTVQVIV
jgi:hypothetical protein